MKNKKTILFVTLLCAVMTSILHINLDAQKPKRGRYSRQNYPQRGRERFDWGYKGKRNHRNTTPGINRIKKFFYHIIPYSKPLDRANLSYWEIENLTNETITIYNDFDSIEIGPKEKIIKPKRLYRRNNFDFTIETTKRFRNFFEMHNHFIKITNTDPIKISSYIEWPGNK